jgi:hypothetical protein
MIRPALTWEIGGLAFGIDRQHVLGIVRSPDLSPVPLAPAWLPGVLSRFGLQVAVVDVALLTGLRSVRAEVAQVLVVGTEAGELGLGVPSAPGDAQVVCTGPGEGCFDRVAVPSGLRLISPSALARAVSAALGSAHA